MVSARKIAILSVLVAFLFLTGAGTAIAAPGSSTAGKAGLEIGEAKRVMILHSYHKGYPWTDMLGKTIMKTLESRYSRVDFVTEYMDVKRDPGVHNLFEQTMLLSSRYRDVGFNLVICTDNPALRLLRAYGEYLFPGTPVIYCGITGEAFALTESENMAGITRRHEIAGNLRLISQILPDVKKIYIVSGQKRDWIESQRDTIDGKFEFEVLDMGDLDLGEVASTGRNLLENSALFITETGHYAWSGLAVFERKAETLLSFATVPVFTTEEHLVKQDKAVGGLVHRAGYYGEMTAEIAGKVLEGVPLEEIHNLEGPSEYVFSSPALERFGIDENVLPPDSLVYNRSRSFWERHGDIIFINFTVAVFALLYAGYLVVSLKKRNLAEKRLRSEKNFMEKLFQNSPEGIVLADENDRVVRMNRYMGEMFEVDPGECVGKPVNDIVASEEDLKEEACVMSRDALAGVKFERETVRSRSDGKHFPVSIKSMPFSAGGENMIYGIYRDITGRKKYEEKLKERLSCEESIFSIASKMVIENHLPAATDICLEDISRFIHADRAYVALYSEERHSWEILHDWISDDHRGVMKSKKSGKDPLTGILPTTLEKLYSEGEVLLDNVSDNEALFSMEELSLLNEAQIRSLVLLPMFRKESICGIAGFINPWKGQAWNIDNINVLRTFRNIVLEALKRQDLEDQLQTRMSSIKSVLEGTVMAIGQIIEIRDPYTAGHQKRVAKLATAIARHLYLSDFQVLGIFYASLVHDIGKINIPAEVLTKPGKLTSLEEELVKRHPYYGWEILRNIDFPWPVANIVLQHHEHYDGTGYPEGLKGVEIMLQARIIAVADALEAMTSDRPYRPARELEESFAMIEKFSGSFYDPEIVSACREICEKTDLLMDDNSFSNV